MAIEKYLTPDYIFNPSPSYDFLWQFDLNNLFNLAIRTKGKETKFHEFYKETFLKPLTKIFNSNALLSFPMGMVSMPNKNRIGRKLVYSKYNFFSALLGFLNQQIDIGRENPEEYKKKLEEIFKTKIDGSNEELNLTFANLFKEKCRRIQDLLNNEIESEYFDAASKDYAPLKSEVDFRTYLKTLYREMNNIQNGLLTLGDFFENALDYNQLAQCFDPDIFYLMFAKIIYEFNLMVEKESNSLDNSFVYLYNYEEAVGKVVKENRKYDPRIVFTLADGRRIHYSRWIFKDEFKNMKERHPDVKAIVLPELSPSEYEKYQDIEIMKKLYELFNEKNFETNWEMLPKGERLKVSGSKKSSNSNRLKQREKDLDTLKSEVDERIKIIEQSGFLTCIKGKNSFAGYYAFVYSTGTVILEKFWSDEERLLPAKEDATFVMNIDNFMEMSKLSKLKLIEYIKSFPNTGVKRRYHTSVNTWHQNIYKAINGEAYELEDVLRFVDRLMREGEERERTNE